MEILEYFGLEPVDEVRERSICGNYYTACQVNDVTPCDTLDEQPCA